MLCAATIGFVLSATGAARAAAPGSLDTTFGSGGIASSGGGTRLFGSTVLSSGKVVSVGESGPGSNADVLVAGFTSNGSPDPSFGSGGIAHGPSIADGPGSIARAVATQSNGKLVVVGSATDVSGVYSHGLIVERYNANGSLDTSFGSGGVVEVLNGSSFGNGYAVAIQPNGQIIATGSAQAAGSDGTAPRVAVVRLNSNGSLDTSFGSGGIDVVDLGAFSVANAVALQPDGKIVIAGSQSPGLQVQNALIARFTPSGALDTSFAGSGAEAHQYAQGAASSGFNGVAIQGDGKIVAGGAATNGQSGADAFVVRFTSSGAQDTSFGSGGVQYTPSAVNWSAGNTPQVPGAYGLLIAPNGDYVLGGVYANGVTTYATLWAMKSTGAADTSFGQGGAAVLTNSDGNNTEYAALALTPTANTFVGTGDSAPFGGSFSGIVARYVGFGATPPPPPPPPPPFKLTLAGLNRSYKLSTVARQGLKFTVGCNQACTLKVSLTGTAAVARQLRIGPTRTVCKKVHGRKRCRKVQTYRPITVATAKATLTKAGMKTFVLRLSRSFINAFNKQKRSVGLTLTVLGTSTVTKKTQTIKRGVKFTR